MMSLRAFLALLLIYIVYLIIGGFTFKATEQAKANDDFHRMKSNRQNLTSKIGKLKGSLHEDQMDLFEDMMNVLNETLPDEPCTPIPSWDFFNSLFFSFTAVTTIGYGHLSPTSELGKGICILYSLLGVPINGILIGSLAAYFGSKLQKFKTPRPSGTSEWSHMLVLTFQVLVYMIFGTIVFILLPAIIFRFVEAEWTYLDAVYFAFITLTTIGFGDMVAGRDEGTKANLGNYLYVYETFVVIWITFGLGYVLMIIMAISDGLKKPASKVAKGFRKAEKVLLEKVLTEVVALKTATRRNQNVNTSADVSDGLSFHNAAFEATPNTVNSDVSDLIEEMNQDTITSLRNFVDSASRYHQKRHSHHYIHSTTGSSITSSNDSISTSGGAGKSASVHGDNNVIASASSNWRRLVPRKLSLRSVANTSLPAGSESMQDDAVASTTVSGMVIQGRKTSVSLPEMLREVTVEEFLQAIERVRETQIVDNSEMESNDEMTDSSDTREII